MIKKLINSSLAKSALIYTCTQTVNSSIPFLLMPVLTRYLTPSDYGMVTMFGVLLSFVVPFTGLSIPGAIARQYYDREEIDMPKFVSNCLLILTVSTLLVGLIFFVFAGPIGGAASFPAQWLWAVVVIAAAQFVNQVNLTLWQVQVKPVAYGIYQIAQTILNMGLTIWFVVGIGLAWQGRLQAQVIAFVSFAFLGLYILKKDGWIKINPDRLYIKSALSYGVPLIPHSLSNVLKTMFDRIFISSMFGLSATGLYSVGYQVGMITGILQDAFNKAYVPWLFERLKRDRAGEKVMIVKATYIYFVVILGFSAALGLIAPWFLTFFVGPQFAGSGEFVMWIAVGFAFNGMYKMVVNYIFYVKKTYILAWVTFFTAASSIVANFFAIRYWGAIGAAYTNALISFLTFALVWYLSGKVYPMPWNLLKHGGLTEKRQKYVD